MIELSREARELLESAAHGDEPTAADRQRVRERLAVRLGAAALATSGAVAASTAVSASAGSAAGASLAGASKGGFLAAFGKLALAASLVGAISTAVMMNQAPPAPQSAVQPQVAPALAEPTPPMVEAAPEPAPLTPPAEEPGVKKPRPARAGARLEPETSTLGAELQVLARAQQALRQGDAQQALELAREHAARFPSGGMREERMGVEALARCALGHDGSVVVDELTRLAPDSPLLARVRAACGMK